MEVAISAVAGELVSRLISFLANKYRSSCSHARSEEEMMERLQHLLMRVRTVVEEADGRYITNSGMLMQLKMLSDAMYRGYQVLDTFKYGALEDTGINEVSNLSSLHLAESLKRSRTTACTREEKVMRLKLHGVLEHLEMVLANVTEFVVFLGGCGRMLRRPYDAYLYNDNIMFGRHAEKQKILNFLLQQNSRGAPEVLPIIGALSIGKKTLAANVCKDERVTSHFSSILHLNEDSFHRIANHGSFMSGETLVVVEFVSHVDKKDWAKFYSCVASMNRGSKVIILSHLKKSEEHGTVKPIFLNALSYEEFSYLFKTLAFGSANPAEHPQLVQVAHEFARELQSKWSLVAANLFADVMRRNLNVHFWLCMLSRLRRVVDRNLSMFGEHPKSLVQRRHQIDVTDALHTASPLRIVPFISGSSTTEVPMKKELPRVTFGDLILDPSVRPKGDFNIITWESRLPPYTSFVHFVPSSAQDMPEDTTPLSGRKRRRVPS